MKKILLQGLMIVGMSLPLMGQGTIVIERGEESKRTDREMVLNGHYLATVEGVDCWLTQSEEGAKGFDKDESWQVAKLTKDLMPLERLELKGTHRCRLLAVNAYDGQAVALLVDSSQRRQTTVLRARVSLDTLRLLQMDTLYSFKMEKKDRCAVWGAVSQNGQYVGLLSVVQYTERKEYMAIASLFDAEVHQQWSREFALRTTEQLYVTDEGELLTLGIEHGAGEETFVLNAIDKNGSETYALTSKSARIKDMQIVNNMGRKVLCAGLMVPFSSGKEAVVSGVASLLFDLDDAGKSKVTLRTFENEDVNILTNEKTKKVQRSMLVKHVVPLAYAPTPWGAVMACGQRYMGIYTSANGTSEATHVAMGVHLVAFDNEGSVKWVRNVRRNDQQKEGNELMYVSLLAEGQEVWMMKSESPKLPSTYDIAKESPDFELGDGKGNLALYRISAEGEVGKELLEQKGKHYLCASARRDDGSLLLLTLNGKRTRQMTVKTE